MAAPSSAWPAVGFLLLIVALAAYRTIQMARGTPVRPIRLLAVAIVYPIIFLLVVVGDLALLPIWIVPAEVALLGGGAVVGTRYVRSSVVLTRLPDGKWSYRLGVLLPLVYIGALAIRLGVNTLLFGGLGTGSSPGIGTEPLAGSAAAAVAVVSTLFALSAGLLVGRSLGVYLAVREGSGGTSAPPPEGVVGAPRAEAPPPRVT